MNEHSKFKLTHYRTAESLSILAQAKRQKLSAAYYDFRKAKVQGIDYFNPALLRRQDGLWLVARRSISNEWEFGKNDLMAFKLDDNHLPQYGIPILPPKIAYGEHFEDPRAFFHDDSWWVSACNFVVHTNGSWTGAHQVLLEVDEHWQVSRRRDPIYSGNGSDVFAQKANEKNWLWFSHENVLHLIYMTQPHLVVRWDNALQVERQYIDTGWHPQWQHGQCRGGTAPVRIGNEYFSFFHSSEHWRNGKRRYHMGAYSFEAHPPFRIKRVTPEPILSGSINDPWAEGKPLVVFPCAAILAGRDWIVSLGVNDLASARITIPHKWLLKKLSSEIEPTKERALLSHSEVIYA